MAGWAWFLIGTGAGIFVTSVALAAWLAKAAKL